MNSKLKKKIFLVFLAVLMVVGFIPIRGLLDTVEAVGQATFEGGKVSGPEVTLNVKVEKFGKITLTKSSTNPEITNGNSNYSVEGAEYTVYKERSLKTKVGVLTVKKDGTSNTLTDILAGKYYIKETKAGKNYELDPKTYEAEVAPNRLYTLKAKDVPKYSKLTLKKLSDESEICKEFSNLYSIAGAIYHVYPTEADARNGKNELGSFTTKADGSSNTLRLYAQNEVFVKEISAPKGHRVDRTIYKVDLTPGKTATLTVSDKLILDPVELLMTKVPVKTADFTGELPSLGGAIYEVKFYNGQYTKDTLPENATRTWQFSLVQKPNSDNAELLLDDAYKVSGDELYKTSKGKPFAPYGTYTFREVTPPEGYLLNSDVLIANLDIEDESGDPSVSTYNAPVHLEELDIKCQLELKKTGKVLSGTSVDENGVTKLEFEEAILGGTTWNVIAVQDTLDSYGKKVYDKNEVVDTIVTEDGATVKSKLLYPGLYKLVEVDAPVKYAKNPNPISVNLTKEDSNKLVEVKDLTTENYRKQANFSITKKFENNGFFDYGEMTAKLGLFVKEDYTENGITLPKDTLLDVITATNPVEQKKIVQKPKMVEETITETFYEIYEYETAEVDDLDKPIFNENGEQIGFEKKIEKTLIKNDEKFKDIELAKARKAEIDAVENHLAEIKEGKETITKQVDSGELEDVEVSEFVFNSVFKPINIGAKLYIKEIETSKGFELDEEEHDIEFDFNETEDFETDANGATITNKNPRNSVEFTKYEEGTTDKPVAGAKFELWAIDEKLGEQKYGEYYTDENGKLSLELPDGKYYLKEVKAPVGYIEDETPIDIEVVQGEVIKETITNQKQPTLQTTATELNTGKKEVDPVTTAVIKDTVRYVDLVIGKVYKIEGHLRDKSTGEKVVDEDGNVITSSVEFTAEERNGFIDLLFNIPARLLRGKEYVVFEKLFRDNKEIAAHEDINDENQSFKVNDTKIGTKFATVDGSKVVYGVGTIDFIDNVALKEGFIRGNKYVLQLKIWVPDDNEFLKDKDGNVITASIEFVYTGQKTVDVPVTIEMTDALKGKDIVAYEWAYANEINENNLIAEHTNADDTNQTVMIQKSEVRIIADTKSEKLIMSPETGDSMNSLFIIYVVAVFISSFGLIVIHELNKRKQC